MPTGHADFNVAASYWLVTLVGAFLGPCAGTYFTFLSYRHWQISWTSVVSLLQPLMVLGLAYPILGGFPESRELLGGSIILVGALWLVGITRGSGVTTIQQE